LAEENNWLFNNSIFDTAPEEYEGFVYLITNTITGRMYIGKKSFWSRRKDKKTKRRKTLESDWKRYYSSSDEVKKEVDQYGRQAFKREILFLCVHKKSMSFYEIREQFIQDVLLKDNFYNTNIAGKFFDDERDRLYKKIKQTGEHNENV
jgi:hypothetical protein